MTPAYFSWMRPYISRYVLGLIALLAVDALNVALTLVLKQGIDSLTEGKAARIWQLGLLYLGLTLLVAMGRYVWRTFLMGSSYRVARDIRISLYRHLLRVSLERNSGISTGDLMSRATNDVESVRMAVGPGLLVAADAVILFILIVPVMWSLSRDLTLLAFCLFPLLPVITYLYGKRVDTLFDSLQTLMSRLSAFTQEKFASVRILKAYGLENFTSLQFENLSNTYKKEGILLSKAEAPFAPLLSLLTYIGTFLILFFGGKKVMEGAITLGTFVAFQRYVVQLAWPMEAIGWAVTMHREGKTALRRLEEILALHPVESVLKDSASPLLGQSHLIDIKELDFKYPKGKFHLSLSNLHVKHGAKIGIVGSVGSGKSTLFHLLLRLFEPGPGAIFFEGKDIRSIPLKELRKKIASVEQGIFLFSETLEENLSLGRDHEDNPWQDLSEVAVFDEEIKALPNGFNTPLGERGITLSGGQKQRVALMRALGRRPDLILLDDAFSAVDVDVEGRILDQFFRRFGDLSMMVISHRLSIMPRMDEIWVFDQGKISGRGTHETLLKENPWYGKLWDRGGRLNEKGEEHA